MFSGYLLYEKVYLHFETSLLVNKCDNEIQHNEINILEPGTSNNVMLEHATAMAC